MNTLAKLFEFGVPFVPLVKRAMVLRGISMDDICTPPLQKPDSGQTKEIEGILKSVGVI